MSKPKQPKTIFAVIGADNDLLGYFKDLKAVQSYLDRESLEEATILEIIAVIDAAYPPEPDLELTDRELSSLLEA